MAKISLKSNIHASPPRFLRFPVQEQMLFAKRLSMILKSGMPIMQGLDMLQKERASSSALYIYRSLITDVSEGHTLSHALFKFSGTFSEFGINVIRVGEKSGTLHENLEYFAAELKRASALRRKIMGALIYPAVIVCATIGITVLLTVYIVPKIIPIFASVKAQLPLSTRILMSVSHVLSEWGWLLIGAIVLGIGAAAFGMRYRQFHRAVDTLVLKIPIIGSLARLYSLATLCRTLAVLLRSDVRIVESIELVAASTRNILFQEELLRARDRIIRGQTISSQFAVRADLFPPLLAQMMSVAEQTGNLSTTLEYLSAYYEEEIDDLTKNITTLIEPVLMIMMGAVVGFIAISIISPIYSITQNLSSH